MKLRTSTFVALITALLFNWTSVTADQILDTYGVGGPQGSWGYSEAVGVGRGNSTSYVPLKSDAVGLMLLGYVNYPGGTGWLNANPKNYDEDAIRDFYTYLYAEKPLALSIVTGIDDGHSIHINDIFISGHGYGIDSTATIFMNTGETVKLEVLGYNGPGPSQTLVIRADNGMPIESTSGLRINAVDDFSVAPEPSSIVFVVSGLVLLLCHMRTICLSRVSTMMAKVM